MSAERMRSDGDGSPRMRRLYSWQRSRPVSGSRPTEETRTYFVKPKNNFELIYYIYTKSKNPALTGWSRYLRKLKLSKLKSCGHPASTLDQGVIQEMLKNTPPRA